MNGIMSILAVGLGLMLPTAARAQDPPPPDPAPTVQAVLAPEPSPGPGGANLASEPVTVTLLAEGAGAESIRFSIDQGETMTYTAPFVLDEGLHEVFFFAINEADEPGPTGSVAVWVDSTAPSSSATLSSPAGPERNGWFRGPVDILLAAEDSGTDPTGVAALEESVSGQGYQPYEGPLTVRVPDGFSGPITYRARDVAGNQEESKRLLVRIDDDPPATTVATAGGRATLSARDAESGVAAIFFSVGAGSEQRYGGPFAIPPGRHSVQFRAVDQAGNVERPRVVSVSGPAASVPPVLAPPRPPVAPSAPAPAPVLITRVATARVVPTARISSVLRRGLVARVSCQSPCRATAKLIVRSRGRRATRPVEIARTPKNTAVAAGRTGVVRLRSSGKARRRLLGLTRSRAPRRATLVVRTKFADGFTLTLTHGVRLTR